MSPEEGALKLSLTGSGQLFFFFYFVVEPAAAGRVPMLQRANVSDKIESSFIPTTL